ncbi:MAG: hypothetical protein AAGG68_13995 [Bacteroidota bacterium]
MQYEVENKHILLIKNLIWVYFILLLFEGALRKWFLPSLSTPLLVVRDPIAIGIIFFSIYYRLIYWNFYLVLILLISLVSMVASLLFGHGNLYVAIYGLRPLLLHFPLIFIVGTLLRQTDVEKIGKFILWLVLPMTLLVILQFYSPQSAWVNRGIGADASGAGFGGALGYFRPPGTFSFTNGNTLFYGLAACFAFYFWLVKSTLPKWILITASIGIIIAVPLSISRSYFFQVLLTLGFSAFCTLSNYKALGKGIFVLLAIGLIFLVLSQFSFFQTGIDVFITRFESANEEEGGMSGVIGDRFLGGLFSAIFNAGEQPILGYGLGMGSNVGSTFLTGKKEFLIAEGEWARIIGEMGFVLGLLLIAIRVSLGVSLFLASFKGLKSSYFLPWILMSFGFLQIAIAGWAQPTSLGFSIFTGGLILASFQKDEKKETKFD